jgi:hypothetical protein
MSCPRVERSCEISMRTNILIQKQRGVSWTVGYGLNKEGNTYFIYHHNKIMVWIQEFLRAESPSLSVEITNMSRCATPKLSIKHRTCKRSVCSCLLLEIIKSNPSKIKQKVLFYAKPPDLRKSIFFVGGGGRLR